jgi:CHAD domain-containing protein
MELRNTAIRTLQRYCSALERTRLRTDTEGLHRLRVRMKKTRSLLRFLEYLDSETPPPKGAVRRSKDLFRAAGALREVQVNCARLNDLRTVPADAHTIGLAHLRKQEERLTKELRRSLERIRPEDFQRLELHALRVLQGRTMNDLRAAARNYVKGALDRARGLTRAADAHLHLHKVRKHLKHVRHIHELLDPGVPEPTGLGKMLGRLGTWHDELVLRTSLQEMRKHPEQRSELLAALDQRLLALRTDAVHRLQLLFGERDHSPRTKSQRTPFHRPTNT